MLTVIIPWFNRLELGKALPSIVENVKEVNGSICIVNFMGNLSLLLPQLSDLKKEVNVISFLGDQPFNKSRAQNLGAGSSKTDYLFFCDCDIILPPSSIKNLLAKVTADDSTFATLQGVRETDQNARKANNLVMFGYELKLKIKNGTTVRIIDNEEDVIEGTRQAPGLLMVKRDHFLKVNGYNSRLKGWGWEDQDMICRLTLSAKVKRVQSETALHISHDDASRMQSYHNYSDRWQSRDAMFRQAIANYDNGDFLGTYQQDTNDYLSCDTAHEASKCNAMS